MRSAVRRLATVAASLVLATVTTTVVTASPAAAATSGGWCNTASVTYSKKGDWISVPARITRGTDTVLCTMGRGSYSGAVAQLQRTLNRCYGEHLKVDRAFGPKTKAALERAQRAHRIKRDGVYGPQSARTLRHPAERGGCKPM